MAGSQNTDRLLFAPTITTRDPNSSALGPSKFQEDVTYVNGLMFESKGESMYLSSRPGVAIAGSSLATATEGRGAYYWPVTGQNYYIVDDKVYKATQLLSGRLDSTSGFIHFSTALSNNNLLLFHDGAKLYSIDSTDKLTCINATAWAASTVYSAGDFVTNDTDKVYRCTTGGTSAGSGGPTGTGSSIADNTCVWDYINTVTGGSNLPEAFVPGLVVLDQYVFVADSSGNIYNSNEGDAFTWTAGDQINSELLADKLVGITRHSNYLLGMGDFGTEIFYNAGNTSGSPLSRLDGTFSYLGCHHGNTIVNMDQETVWVSQNQVGRLDVVIMKGLELERTATPAISAALQHKSANQFMEAYYYNLWGRRLYVLNIITGLSPASSRRQGNCFVLDIDSKLWFVWDYTNGPSTYSTSCWPFRGSARSSQDDGTRLIERISVGSGAGDTALGTIYQRAIREDIFYDQEYVEGVLTTLPLNYEIQTAVWDANNSATKFIHRVDLLVDKSKGAGTATIKWQDEDASSTTAPTYSSTRTIDLNTNIAKKIHRLGSCVRRRFHVKVQSDDGTYAAPRAQGLDIFYTQGAHGNS